MHKQALILASLVVLFLLPIAAHGKEVTLAVSQFKIAGGTDNKTLFKKISDQAAEAKGKGADILLLPEWLTLDTWPKNTKLNDKEIIDKVLKETTDPFVQLLVKLAKQHEMLIVGGSTSLKEKDKIYNAAPIVQPSGKVTYHRKVKLTAWERQQELGAGIGPTILDTEFGRIAVLICYDVEFPDLSVQLVKERPQILLVPSMTESSQGVGRVRWTTQARVVEHSMYAAVAVTAGKTWKGWHHFGKAVVLAPQLKGFTSVVAEGDGSSHSLTIAKVDLDKLDKARATSTWQPAKDMQPKATHE